MPYFQACILEKTLTYNPAKNGGSEVEHQAKSGNSENFDIGFFVILIDIAKNSFLEGRLVTMLCPHTVLRLLQYFLIF